MDDVGDRAAVNALSIKLIADLHRTTLAWSRWAKDTTADWGSTRAR